MKLGFIFPGQGAQAHNMGMDILEAYPEKEQLFYKIKNITSLDIKQIIKSGSTEEITDPYISGILVFSVSVMINEILSEHAIKPEACAGYSIGQYAALVASGSLDLSTGLKLVSKRGELLKKYASLNNSGMLGVIGLTEIQITSALEKTNESYIANFSTPTNFSISYKLERKKELIEAINQLNPLKIVELPVQGGWHSPFMKGAADEFNTYLQKEEIKVPTCTFYDNYTGGLNNDAKEIKRNLYHHIFQPVKWYQSVKNMIADGVDTFIEIGYGDQLTKFSMLINRKTKVYNTSDLANLKEVLQLQGSFQS